MYLVRLNNVFAVEIKARTSKEALMNALIQEGFSANIAKEYESVTGISYVKDLSTNKEKQYNLCNIKWEN